VSRAVGPGGASLIGLRWLASVGPAPLGAWGAATGWATSTAFSHAARLVAAGLAASCSMRRGQGSLFYATPRGVRECGLDAVAPRCAPAPSTWAHWSACAWTAAWLTSRGREVVGSRELQLDDAWREEVEWLERDGLRRRGHHPDLAGALVPNGRWLPIEVELAHKSTNRLRSILGLHASWISARKTDAVMYVCISQTTAERILRHGNELGLSVERRTLRVETLTAIHEAAVHAVSGHAPHALATAQAA
jgi:hypothetical protein